MFSIAALFSCGQLNAQVTNGIEGTVTDSTGALLPNVAVTITNNSTGVVSRATTSAVGTYTVIGLQPGQYSVAAEAAGFERSVQTDVTVEVARKSLVVFQLVPGATSATINAWPSLGHHGPIYRK
jgi:hypothetical protein